MSKKEEILWKKIDNFEIDDPEANYTFSMRLAKENDWGFEYTLRAIEEYKRFIFLAMVEEHPASPSYVIDQVWHLHLIYTHSYWDDLCNGILGKNIHHIPTNGNKGIGQFHQDLYLKTLQSYFEKFGEEAPEDIWTRPNKNTPQKQESLTNKFINWFKNKT